MMGHFLFTAWHVDVVFLAGCLAALTGYATAVRRPDPRAALCFGGGLLLLALAVLSPLDTLAREYLLSAHMTQHLILTQIVPPLLLLGLPASLVERALRHPALAAAERQIRRPLLAWSTGIGMLWLWHAPPIFDLAHANHTLGHLHHLSVLAAGLVFWWPVFSPLERSRLGALPAVAYLAAACLASTVLGIMLAFAPEGVYAAYRRPADLHGILPELRSAGLTPRTDQQIGGLLMWVPCCLLYLGAIVVVLARWYATPEPAAAAIDRRAPAAR